MVTWTQIDDNSKVYSTGKSLRVQNAEKSDFGTYQCTAASVRGENVSALATVEMDNCKLTFKWSGACVKPHKIYLILVPL